MIPIQIESEDRKTNLTIVVDYILKHYNTKIIICEQDRVSKVEKLFKHEWRNSVKHIFVKSDSDLFHKTRCLNTMAKASETPIVISYDSDVLFPINQIYDAVQNIVKRKSFFTYPFNTRLYHIEKPQIPKIRETLDISSIGSNTSMRNKDIPPGGCLVMDKASLFRCQGYHEGMISYGPEDQEIVYRVAKLGFPVDRVVGPIFHLEHVRTPNSNHQHSHYQRNNEEYDKIKAMTEKQLKDYIGTWNWLH